MKKLFSLFLSFVTLFSFLYIPNVSAKTVGDLERELNQKLEEADKNENDIKYTEEQINTTKKNINQSYVDIDKAQDEMLSKTKEIENLNLEIQDKNKEIKNLVSFIQLSQGNNEYLEYIAGAETMTDFIYRVSVTEQLVDYNDSLINQMNQKIKDNENKKIELAKQEEELRQKQAYLSSQLNILGAKRVDLEDYSQSLSDEIKTAQEVLNLYKKAGCQSNDDISVCSRKLLPPDTRFWRPLATGYVTSEYGYRGLPGTTPFHYAVDLSASNKTNVSIYSVAAGKVVKVIPYTGKESGGNQVIVHHSIIVNGKTTKYTSYYCHLASIKVKAGDIVSKDTVIGIMGTTGNSTGPHLHLSIAYGYWYTDYTSYTTFTANTINPRLVINFPGGLHNTWVNRTTAY
jgi:murein DD-endopeptidase MepM/ murein hydrolase activator NlpD